MLRTSPGSLTAAHPPHHHQLPPVPPLPRHHVPLPSALSDPQGAGYSDFLLGGLPSSPGNLYRQDLGWDNDSNKGFLELERGESQGWQILGEN